MVAYSFKAQFTAPIEAGTKCQTVRGFRKRHARPGEPIQLYTAMRTRQCRKLIDLDPICFDLRTIAMWFDLRSQPQIGGIEIDGNVLSAWDVEQFAIADGFGAEQPDGLAAQRMAQFWLDNHGKTGFVGVVIRWRPQF